jgi:cell division protein FtsI (penicillin-binding protein 3)
VFEPGSTIKPFTVAAAMQAGMYSPRSRIDTSPGMLRVGGNLIRDMHDYGQIDLTTLLKKSSNIGASKLALSLAPRDLWDMMSGVGFGYETGSGFPGESAGTLPDYTGWRDIERATLSFGYGLSVTALQLARAYTVFANDGVLPAISFTRQLNPPRAFDAFTQRVIDAKTARKVRTMLETVVQPGGTATKAKIPGYRVAGKTGTVKKLGENGYVDDHYIAVFAGMAPASDPRLVMVVMVDDPGGDQYYGGQVAAPVFAKVMEGALRMLDVAPDDLPSMDGARFAFLDKQK